MADIMTRRVRIMVVLSVSLLTAAAGLRRAVAAGDTEFESLQRNIETVRLSNGMRVLLCRHGTAPIVACATYIRAGAMDDGRLRGTARLFDYMAFNGSTTAGTANFAAERDAWSEMERIDRVLERQIDSASYLQLLNARTSSTGALNDAAEACLRTWLAGLKIPPSEQAKASVQTNLIAWFQALAVAREHARGAEYRQALEQAGGRGLSSFVNADRMLSVVSIPAERLELWCALEADRLANWVPRGLETARRKALADFKRHCEDSPFGRLHEHFLATIFHRHPYGQGNLGTLQDLLQIGRQDVQDYHAQHIIPENIVLCLVGQFDSTTLMNWLEVYFAKIPVSSKRRIWSDREPLQNGERRLDLAYPARPICMVGFRIPARSHPDAVALRILQEACTENSGSRLYRRLVKNRLAYSLQAWIGPGQRDEGVLTVSAEPFDGISLDELEMQLLKELDALSTEPLVAEELQSARNRLRFALSGTLSTQVGLASELAEAEAILGAWRSLFDELSRAAVLEADEIARVAERYLKPQHRTVARLVSTLPVDPDLLLGTERNATSSTE